MTDSDTDRDRDRDRPRDGGAGTRTRSLTPPPRMTPGRTVAWGLVGTLTFLVLHQGYLLVGGRFLGIAPVVTVAVVVGVVVAATARWLAARASGNGQR